MHPNVFNFDENDINLKIKYEDLYLNQGIPFGTECPVRLYVSGQFDGSWPNWLGPLGQER